MSADPPPADPSVDPVAELLVRRLTAAGQTVACAESLTGGLVCATLVSVPGASAVVRGGVVAYAVDAKAALLGVDPDLLGRVGAVDPEVAAALARGAARVLGATWGVGTTGVAGPDPSDGQPVGTVYVACARRDAVPVVRRLTLAGDRATIRWGSVDAVLGLALETLAGASTARRPG